MLRVKLIYIFLVVSSLCVFLSCSDEEKENPVILAGYESNTINYIFNDIDDFTYLIKGGDGEYTAKSLMPEVVTAEMISSSDLKITVIGVGRAEVIVLDKSGNVLKLDVNVEYITARYVVKGFDVEISGELNDTEIKAIREEALATIPVKVGGGYKFLITDKNENKNKAKGFTLLYPEQYGYDEENIPLEVERISPKFFYIPVVDGVERRFEATVLPQTKKENPIEPYDIVLAEDVTDLFKDRYPTIEKVVTYQLSDDVL